MANRQYDVIKNADGSKTYRKKGLGKQSGSANVGTLAATGGVTLGAIAANDLFNPQTTQANQLFDNQSHGMLADSYNKPPRKLDDLSSIDSIQAGHGSMGNQLQNWTGRQLSKLQKNIPALSMLTDIDDIAKLNRKSLQGEEVTSEDKYRAIPGLSGAYDVKDLYNHFFN
jgi:hypothetical protein